MNQSSPSLLQQATILVIEDEEMTVRLLKRMLQRAGYSDIHTTLDPFEALTLYHELDPDLVVLDLHMPYCNGFVVLEQLRAEASERAYLPVLMLTGDTSVEAKHQAFTLGVTDFLTKPLDFLEVRYRVSNLLRTRLLYLEMERQSRLLAETIEVRGPLPEESSRASESVQDPRNRRVATLRHDLVGQVAGRLAAALGLDEEEVERIRWVAHLFRAARTGAALTVGRRLDWLAVQEADRMKSYMREEAKLLFVTPPLELLAMVEQVALARHEHWDGSGYPQGLSGEQIPLASRIVAVAEHFADLVQSPRWRNAAPTGDGLMEIALRGGRRFDPQVVKALLDLHARGGVGASAME